MHSSSLAVFLFGASAFASCQFGSSHECVERLPHGWIRGRTASNDAPLALRAFLRYPDRNFIRAAEEISDPSSTEYGKHLSAGDLSNTLPNRTDASSAVISWLESHNITDYDIGQDSIDFTTSVGDANRMLDSSFASYRYLDEEPVMRVEDYRLPSDISPHLDFIFPTVHFMAPKKIHTPTLERRQRLGAGSANCTNSVCLSQVKEKYNIDYVPKDGSSGSQIAIAGFLDSYPNITDVKSFLSQYGIDKDMEFPPYEGVSINGGTVKTPKSSAFTVEAELDMDYVIPFTGPLPVTYYSTGGRGKLLSQPGNEPVGRNESTNEPFLKFFQHLLAQENPPQVVSISYSDDEQSVPIKYAQRVCDLIAQAASRGISVIGASGDGGASGTGGNTQCIGPDGERRFIPTFPSSCPWMTSVGAVASYGGVASFSSGGLSNYFARPEWQDEQVQGYINKTKGEYDGLFHKTGRGIPDVTLLGDDFLTLTAGSPGNHDGTSASTPVFASMIALINDIRLRNNRPALGFLNPLLYAKKAKDVYHDIDDKSNIIGCADGNYIAAGFEAVAGWDPASGLGEPDFAKLEKVLR